VEGEWCRLEAILKKSKLAYLNEIVNQASAIKLRIDLAVAFLLLVIAQAGRPGSPNSEICFYLGDRYWRLADFYQRRGAISKAKRLRDKAEKYLRASGWWRGGPPPAAAMAMSIPERPIFTAAIGWRVPRGPPDDAA
jgi:hypothetical protein